MSIPLINFAEHFWDYIETSSNLISNILFACDIFMPELQTLKEACPPEVL
jgi:hypothetical protein